MTAEYKGFPQELRKVVDKSQCDLEPQEPLMFCLQRWLDDPETLFTTEVDIGFPQEFYTACISFFKSNYKKFTKTVKEDDNYRLNDLKEPLVRLHLWGLGFVDGKLATALDQSDELRDTVLELLSDLSQLLMNSKLNLLLATSWNTIPLGY